MRVERNMVDKKLQYSKARGNEKMQVGTGNILATIHKPVGIKTLKLIKHLRRNLVPLPHLPYAGHRKFAAHKKYLQYEQICTQSTLACCC